MTRPTLRVLRGDPTPEELAVLTALVSAAGGEGAASAEPAARGRWNDPHRALRAPLHPGPGAWRASAFR